MPKPNAPGDFRNMSSILLISITLFLSSCANTSSTRTRNTSELVSDKALLHAQLARGYLQQKQYAVAKGELEKALRIDPNHTDSNYVMGLLMMELEQYEETEKYLRRAVRSDRNNSSAAHDLGTFLCQRGDPQAAVGFYEIAVSNPFFKQAALSYMRAGECMARENRSKAEQYLKKALELNPNMRPALYRLAVLKYDAGAYLSSRAYIERYFAITKAQPESLLLAYKIESKLRASDVAARYRTELLEQFPGSDEAASLRQKSRR